MAQPVYFTPGPSELYPGVEEHMQAAMAAKLGSISHRSQQFKTIYAHAVTGLRKLLALPENYQILFLSSANEVWERAIQNTVERESFHLVNGAFSERFYEISRELGRIATKYKVPDGEGFDVAQINVPTTAELIALTQNETSTGASMPVSDIHLFREKASLEALIFVDAVSSMPFPAFDYSKIDAVYFSVQKCFGLPAGLGVWLLNERCIQKAESLLQKGFSIGSYHSIPSLLKKALSNQTPETPNVLNIYLLGQVVEAMNQKGIELIRQETELKARLLYTFLETSKTFAPAVKEAAYRSLTTIVADTHLPASEVNKFLAPHHMVVGSGYGQNKETQIRIANFPAHTVDQVKTLISSLHALDLA